MHKVIPETIIALKTIAYTITIGTIILIYSEKKETIATTAIEIEPPKKLENLLGTIDTNKTNPLSWNQEEILKSIEAELRTPPVTIAELTSIVNSDKESTLIIDARDKIFYEREHIPKALNMTIEDFIKDTKHFTELLSKYEQVIIYCTSKTCRDSKVLKSKLEEYKIHNVRIFEGGFREWKETRRITNGEDKGNEN